MTLTATTDGETRSNNSTVARSASPSAPRGSIVPAFEAGWM
jgi:hypothetical protein